MKGLWHDLAPFATDTNGASSVFLELPALVIAQDSNGSASTLRRVVQRNKNWGSVQCLNLPEICYELGFTEDFLARMNEICEATPRDFVVLVHGPVSALVGIDLEGLSRSLDEHTNIRSYAIETCGNEYYDAGLGLAYNLICQEFVDWSRNAAWPGAVNVLGLNLLDFAGPELREAVLGGLRAQGMDVLSVWGCQDGPAAWANAAHASRNIVASASALPIARRLEAEQGIPFTTIDTMGLVDHWAAGLSLERGPRVLVVGEQVQSNLLRRLLVGMGASSVEVAGFFMMDSELMEAGDKRLCGEADLRRLMGGSDYDLIIGDETFARFAAAPYKPLLHAPACFGRLEPCGLCPAWLESLAREWNAL